VNRRCSGETGRRRKSSLGSKLSCTDSDIETDQMFVEEKRAEYFDLRNLMEYREKLASSWQSDSDRFGVETRLRSFQSDANPGCDKVTYRMKDLPREHKEQSGPTFLSCVPHY
jgi:hypothetical protein